MWEFPCDLTVCLTKGGLADALNDQVLEDRDIQLPPRIRLLAVRRRERVLIDRRRHREWCRRVGRVVQTHRVRAGLRQRRL